MVKVAKMDAKVSHNCSDGVILAPRIYDEYRPLRLRHVPRHKFCIVVKMDLYGKSRKVPPPESICEYPIVVIELSIFVKESFRFKGKRFSVYTFVMCHGP